MKNKILIVLAVLLLILCGALAISYWEIFQYRNRKVLTSVRIERKAFPDDIPVVYRQTMMKGHFLMALTDQGQYGLFADRKQKKIFFCSMRNVLLGAIPVTYEVTDQHCKEKIFAFLQLP